MVRRETPHLSSEAVRNHGNGSLDTEGAALPVAEALHLRVKLRPPQEAWLTCTHLVSWSFTATGSRRETHLSCPSCTSPRRREEAGT